jgi:Flp pilus assembly protein TadG
MPRLAQAARDGRGAALVELAVALPVLVVLLFGVIDFARVFYVAAELTNAARAGAQYGALNTTNASDTGTMQTRALAASPQIAGYTVSTPTRSCGCMTQSGTFTSQACTTSCPNSADHLVVYVTVTASMTFNTVTRLPGLPQTLPLTRSATVRAQ